MSKEDWLTDGTSGEHSDLPSILVLKTGREDRSEHLTKRIYCENDTNLHSGALRAEIGMELPHRVNF